MTFPFSPFPARCWPVALLRVAVYQRKLRTIPSQTIHVNLPPTFYKGVPLERHSYSANESHKWVCLLRESNPKPPTHEPISFPKWLLSVSWINSVNSKQVINLWNCFVRSYFYLFCHNQLWTFLPSWRSQQGLLPTSVVRSSSRSIKALISQDGYSC